MVSVIANSAQRRILGTADALKLHAVTGFSKRLGRPANEARCSRISDGPTGLRKVRMSKQLQYLKVHGAAFTIPGTDKDTVIKPFQ